MLRTREFIKTLDGLELQNMYNSDFLLTWDKTDDEVMSVFTVADALKDMRMNNISPRVFDSGLGVSLFRDPSIRTRFSYASACNMLGLAVQDLAGGENRLAHWEEVRETANMVSFMADVIGIRDDRYIGKGNAAMGQVSRAVQEGFKGGILEQRPTVLNLQCDMDHPTQSMSDLQHLIHHFGGAEKLRGKKMAITWAYSPSPGKALSVAQGLIGLMSRMGMDIVLAHPEGYELMWDVEKIAMEKAEHSESTFTKVDSMAEAFEGADIVFARNWAPFKVLEQRTAFHGNEVAVKGLEAELMERNRTHKDWECTEELMETTNSAIYMHCLPADITGVSCETGEVSAKVFESFRELLYKEASYKPYIIAAMILLSKVKNPQRTLSDLTARNFPRFF